MMPVSRPSAACDDCVAVLLPCMYVCGSCIWSINGDVRLRLDFEPLLSKQIQCEADLDTWIAFDSAPAMYSRCDTNEEGMCITLHVDSHIRPIAACHKLKRGLEVFAEASSPKFTPPLSLSDARFPGAALAAAAAVRQRNRDLGELKACVAQVSVVVDHRCARADGTNGLLELSCCPFLCDWWWCVAACLE